MPKILLTSVLILVGLFQSIGKVLKMENDVNKESINGVLYAFIGGIVFVISLWIVMDYIEPLFMCKG